MKIETAVREYLIEIEVRKYTPRTIKGYRTNLNLFLRFCKEKSMIKKAAVSDFIGAWGAVSHQRANGSVYTEPLLATTASVQKQGLNVASIGAILCS